MFTAENGPVLAPTDRAIPVGLLVNELVTNAFKYAYPGEVPGSEVHVGLSTPAPDLIRLKAADRGRGLPEGFDVRRPASGGLGTRLIGGFTRQVDGTLQVESGGGGTRFVLKFPTPAPDHHPDEVGQQRHAR